MRTNYNIEDLVFQNENLVLYRVQTPDGTTLALVRLRYEDDILARLKEGRFTNALQELQALKHQNLRSILDGGLDPVDSAPWVVIRWEEGIVLSDRIKQGPLLSQEEYDRIKDQGSHLIEALGPVASTLSFTPASVVTSGDDPADLIDTFSVDYHAWFHAFAQDIHPATLSASYQKLADLLTRLRSFTQHTPASLLTSDLAPPTQLSTISQPCSNIVALPSTAKSPFPLKALLLVGTLLLGIGAAIWTLTQRGESAPQISATSSSPKKTAQSHLTNLINRSSSQVRPDRPRLDVEYAKIKADDPSSLKNNLGKWVQISGKITDLNSKGQLIFANSTLRVTLPPDSDSTARSAIGNTGIIQGFLESLTNLEIENQADIKPDFHPKNIYTVADETQLREMSGKIVTIEGKILRHGTSNSKKTHYLHFKTKDQKLEFAIGIQRSKAENSINRAFLKSLVNQTRRIKGKLKIDGNGNRLSIILNKKSQLTRVE